MEEEEEKTLELETEEGMKKSLHFLSLTFAPL